MILSAQLRAVAGFMCCFAAVLPLASCQPASGKQPSAAQSTPAPLVAVPATGGMMPAAPTAAAGSYGRAAMSTGPAPAAAASPAAFGPPAPKAPNVLGPVIDGTASQFGGPQASRICHAIRIDVTVWRCLLASND